MFKNILYQKNIMIKNDNEDYKGYYPTIFLTEENNCFIIWYHDGITGDLFLEIKRSKNNAIEKAVTWAQLSKDEIFSMLSKNKRDKKNE